MNTQINANDSLQEQSLGPDTGVLPPPPFSLSRYKEACSSRKNQRISARMNTLKDTQIFVQKCQQTKTDTRILPCIYYETTSVAKFVPGGQKGSRFKPPIIPNDIR